MSEQQKALLSLPVRMGIIGIRDPVESAQLHTPPKETPRQLFQPGKQRTNEEVKLNAALKPMNTRKKRAIMRAVEGINFKLADSLTRRPPLL